MSSKLVHLGAVTGTDGDGKSVTVYVAKRGRSFYLSGPNSTSHLAHPSRRDIEGVIREVEMVWALTNAKYGPRT